MRKTPVLSLHSSEHTHVHVPHTIHRKQEAGEKPWDLTFPCFRQCNLVHVASRVLKPESLLNGDATLTGMEPVLAPSDGISSPVSGAFREEVIRGSYDTPVMAKEFERL